MARSKGIRTMQTGRHHVGKHPISARSKAPPKPAVEASRSSSRLKLLGKSNVPFKPTLRPGSACVFWTLPADLRNEIYALVYTEDKLIVVNAWPKSKKGFLVNRLLVCKDYYTEAMPIFCGSNIFKFSSLQDLCHLADGVLDGGAVMLDSTGHGNQLSEGVRKNMTRVVYPFKNTAYGRNNHAFEELYVHCDCIVNGLPNLREIRVGVDQKLIFATYCGNRNRGDVLSVEDFNKIRGVKKIRNMQRSVRVMFDKVARPASKHGQGGATQGHAHKKQYQANLRALEKYLNGEEI